MDNDLRRLLRGMDWGFVTAVLLCCLLGLLSVFSATKSLENSNKLMLVQTIAFLIGIVGMYATVVFDYESLGNKTRLIYIINVVLLIIVLAFGMGREEVGGQSWLRYGFFGFQPSELVKIGYIITLAKLIEKVKDDLNNIKVFFGVLLHAGFLIGLVLLQPDYGTAMVYAFIFICMVVSAGLYYRYILTALGALGVFAPIAWFFILKSYQKQRFLVFLNPEHDPSDAGYQVMQSKIAIGSGEFVGKGILRGAQTQLGILPAKQTDFIFAVIGEEMGFWGAFLVIALLFFIIIKCFIVAQNARGDFGALLCVGIAAMLLFHVFENVGMCLGMVPVTGIPLPFFSYGGSSLFTNLLAMGIVMNVWIRRKTINF